MSAPVVRVSQSFTYDEVVLLAAILRNVKRGRLGDLIGVVKRHPREFEQLVRKVDAMMRTAEARRAEQEPKAS